MVSNRDAKAIRPRISGSETRLKYTLVDGVDWPSVPVRCRPGCNFEGATMAQTLSFNGRRRVRKFFGKIPEVTEMPNLIEVQKASYDQFLMVEEPKGGRPDEGVQSVFKSVFPITDFSGASMLEF